MASFAARVRRALLIVVGGERLRSDPLFDSEWYRWAYPDSPRSERGAARHYAVVGGHERIPSADFAANRYVAKFPDVIGSRLNPLVHYQRFGRREGREVQPHFTRYFVDDAGHLNRDALSEFLRSGSLLEGRGSVLRALPHLLHAMPRRTARGFGAILAALANERIEDLGPVVVTGPTRGALAGVSVSIVGEPDGILATASLAALMVGGEVGREQIALPGEDSTEGDVLVEVDAGALVVPGSIAHLVEHARRAAGRTVTGVALEPDGVPVARWDALDASGPSVLRARLVPADDDARRTVHAPEVDDELPVVGGATAVWWPASVVTPRPVPRPRALVMNDALPTPDRDSGSLSALSHLRTLVSLGYRVVFVPQDLRFHPRYTPELESWGVEVVDERYVESFEQVAESLPFAVALLVRYPVFVWAFDRLRCAQPDVPVLFAPLDLHHVRMAAQASLSNDADLVATAAEVGKVELSALARADATIMASSTEVERAQQLVPTARIVRIPMARDRVAAAGIQEWSDRNDLVFVGSYGHPPNPDAVHWFLDEVWPSVAERLPDARFVAYGSAMPDDLLARATDRVVMHGYVERLAEAFATARLGVAPLRFGAGVKGKITSTMLSGIPVVSTPVGVEGMDVPGDAIVVAAGAAEFADAIVELWGDEPRLTALSASALDVASTRFSFEAQRAALAALLDSLM